MESPTEATEQSRDYLSYLLRLWRENTGEGIWRASLEDPQTGERLGFASPEALFAFLRGRMDAGPSAAGTAERCGQTGHQQAD